MFKHFEKIKYDIGCTCFMVKSCKIRGATDTRGTVKLIYQK